MPIGIPDKTNFGDLDQLKPGRLYDWVVQNHIARRAGTHKDIRLGDESNGLFSWASKKGLPQPGQKHLAIQQPVHSHEYKDFAGEIPEGYGAGTVKRDDLGKVLVTDINPNSISFSTAHTRFPERYRMVKLKGDKNWLMMNVTKDKPLGYERPHYQLIPQSKAEDVISNLQPGSSTQAKVDGTSALLKLYKDHYDVLSTRTQKRRPNFPITYAEKIEPIRRKLDVPKEHVGRVLRGELYGEQNGKPIPPHQLGGLLNSSLAKSLTDQASQRIKLKMMLFDVLDKQNKHQFNVPYAQRLAETKAIGSVLPSDIFHYPEEAKTPTEAKQLLEQVSSGKHPLTEEGIVIHPETGVPQKIKLRDEYKPYLREFFAGKGRLTNSGVGGFRYSWEPEGEIAGEVGTGMSDDERKNMHLNPSDYIGRKVRLTAQKKLPSGNLFAPSFHSLYNDEPPESTEAVSKAISNLGTASGLIKAKRQPKSNLVDYVKPASSAVKQLIEAKSESDRRNYKSKHDIVRKLMMEKPDDFMIDSSQDGIVGVTHKPSGFKLHMPRQAMPTGIK
jgi:hypothetical protein